MPAAEAARGQPHESDAVAVVGVHVRLDLEHEAGDLVVAGGHVGLLARAARRHAARRRGIGAQILQQLVDAEMAQGRAEQAPASCALRGNFADRRAWRRPRRATRPRATSSRSSASRRCVQRVGGQGDAARHAPAAVPSERQEAVMAQVDHALEAGSRAGRPDRAARGRAPVWRRSRPAARTGPAPPGPSC